MRYATLFSGIEAPSVAWAGLGWHPVFFSEIDRFASDVLSVRQRGELRETNILPALSTGGGKAGQGVSVVRCGKIIRRITPVEAERAMGFPDGYTDIYPKTPDSARFKVLGNSMAVPVMRWIGERIKFVDTL